MPPMVSLRRSLPPPQYWAGAEAEGAEAEGAEAEGADAEGVTACSLDGAASVDCVWNCPDGAVRRWPVLSCITEMTGPRIFEPDCLAVCVVPPEPAPVPLWPRGVGADKVRAAMRQPTRVNALIIFLMGLRSQFAGVNRSTDEGRPGVFADRYLTDGQVARTSGGRGYDSPRVHLTRRKAQD